MDPGCFATSQASCRSVAAEPGSMGRVTRNKPRRDRLYRKSSMQHGLVIVVKQHAIMAYFVLAFALSWAVELPLAASAHGWLRVPPALHYLASFGPLLSALIITAATEGRQGLRQLLAGLLKWRVGPGWMLLATGAPVALFAIAASVGYATDRTWPDLTLL